MLNEIRIALRGLAKTPGFTVIAIVTVALAIGANSAVFSLINGVLIKKLPYSNPARLVFLWEQFAAQGLDRIPVSAPEYLEFERELKGVEEIAAFDYTTFNLANGGTPERISGAVVAPALFPLLGAEAMKGRTFARDEQGKGHDDVIVISERLWQRRFNSDPLLVGKTLVLNGRSYNVIGVMPKAFEFPLPLFNMQGAQFAERVDIWKPLAFTPQELKSRGSRSYGVVGRLRPGMTVPTTQAELDTMVKNWARLYPDNYSAADRFSAKIYPMHEQVVGGIRKGLVILLCAVGFVLLIACANLATMLLARASARERELAIRVALGAGPWRVLRQLLTESIVLAVAGGAAGLLLSVWAIELLKQIGARTIPRLAEVNLDLTVLTVTAVASVMTGILFGLIPALVSAKPELTEVLKEGGRGSSAGGRRNRIRSALVITEIALALVLLVGAGLLTKSFVRLQNVDLGFNPDKVVTMELSLPKAKYPSPGGGDEGGESTINFFTEADRRIAQLPGVEASSCTSILPLSGTNSDSSFAIEGRVAAADQPMPDEEIREITPDYFRVMQTPLRRGRFFNDGDMAAAPAVAIVNEALVRKYWPNQDALGKRITFSDTRKPNAKWITVVGIVGNIRHRGLDAEAQPEYYLPHAQNASRSMVLAVRSGQDPRNLVRAIRREIQAMDAEQPIANVRTFDAVVADSVAPRRLSVVLLGVFAGIALLLASVGIYGVISYLVVQRTHEIGVRMALGAQRRDVLTLVVGHASKLVGIGIAAGLVLAILVARSLSALLYHVGAFDPVTFIVVTCVLGAVALLASYVPALRATRADPMIALSHNA